jgi:hypothetical protein
MYYQSDYATKLIQERRIKEFVRTAEIDRLDHELGAKKPGRLCRWTRGLLHAAGHVLLDAGQQLDRLGTADAHLKLEQGTLDGNR